MVQPLVCPGGCSTGVWGFVFCSCWGHVLESLRSGWFKALKSLTLFLSGSFLIKEAPSHPSPLVLGDASETLVLEPGVRKEHWLWNARAGFEFCLHGMPCALDLVLSFELCRSVCNMGSSALSEGSPCLAGRSFVMQKQRPNASGEPGLGVIKVVTAVSHAPRTCPAWPQQGMLASCVTLSGTLSLSPCAMAPAPRGVARQARGRGL